ncbi:BTB-domain-containing protein [Rhizophagus irregularis]|uniref:BTB-domain-containing protein n=1 Tax=Rhizophagus irregularis TaxID=588596 RepID=A0A2I1G4J5_9GLOM|nr:BTB-domain-containing protein [Rhizophagus irregularis]
MNSRFHSDLSKDLLLMLNDKEDYNVIIQVGENHNMKEFRTHSNILRARSPYFKSALSAKWTTKRNNNNSTKNNIIEFKKPNIDPKVFEIILKFIYTGEVDLYRQSGENILGVLVASDELLLKKLFDHVQDYLIERETSWIKQNFVHVLHTVFKVPNCERLKDYCLESICANPQPLITSEDFPLLDKDILHSLLERDNLNLEEIVAWDCLIKWGIDQTSGLGSENNDRTKWDDDDYEALKETISQFIPLIRFVGISPADFYDKVRPYKAVIPYYIYEEVTEFYYKNALPKTTILPPRYEKTQIESKLIKPKLAEIIASWIERKDGKNLSPLSPTKTYKFDLLYRSNRDGMSYKTFRLKCKGQGPCLGLVKMKNKNKIYGGYNSRNFSYSRVEYYNPIGSFIFSFENSEDNQNMKINRFKSGLLPRKKGFNFGDAIYMSGRYIHFDSKHDSKISNVLDLADVKDECIQFIPENVEVFKVTTS